ncbi:MAG: hypothetical protein HY553_10390 [Elusimicrobia bacterium]|nr:hypothetical protein [Elusimicrobiota bacterium]
MTQPDDKRFQQRLSWALVLPISALGGAAVAVAFLALEVALEGESAGSAAWVVAPARAAACGYVVARLAASIAPARKGAAAAVLAVLYAALAWRSGPDAVSAGFGAAGALAGAALARKLPDDKDDEAPQKA